MHPPFSVIFLTTLIGAGQGLFLALSALELGVFGTPPAARFFVVGDVIVLILLGGGLIASFFHLGHPERAWRAVTQWRTSWLSREVIALPVFGALVAAHALAHYLGAPSAAVIGVVAAGASLALYYITAMNYVCIRFLREWATPLTVVNYTLLGGASGFLLATVLAAWGHTEAAGDLAQATVVLTAVAAVARILTVLRNARLRPVSTLQTAIGVRNPRIVQKSPGFSGSSFNTREFFHGRTRAVVRLVKWIFLVCTFPVPLILLTLGAEGGLLPLAVVAFVVQYVGLIAERWFFFAQANHPQNLYYQVAG